MGGKAPKIDVYRLLGEPEDFYRRLDDAIELGYIELALGIKDGRIPCHFLIFKRHPITPLEDDNVDV